MFKLNRWLAAGALLVGVASLQSCLDDDNGYPYDLCNRAWTTITAIRMTC